MRPRRASVMISRQALSPLPLPGRHETDSQPWLGFETYTERLADSVPLLVPQVRAVRTPDGRLYLKRGNAAATIDWDSAIGVSIVLFQRNAPILRGTARLTAQSVYEVTADLVGFFCGASLCTMSVYPHREPRVVPPRRRRWNQHY